MKMNNIATDKNSGNWRIKTNIELDELIKNRNIINYVKAQRFSWIGHRNIMPETSIVKKIRLWKPFAGRPVGRPKSRWEEEVKNDLSHEMVKTSPNSPQMEKSYLEGQESTRVVAPGKKKIKSSK